MESVHGNLCYGYFSCVSTDSDGTACCTAKGFYDLYVFLKQGVRDVDVVLVLGHKQRIERVDGQHRAPYASGITSDSVLILRGGKIKDHSGQNISHQAPDGHESDGDQRRMPVTETRRAFESHSKSAILPGSVTEKPCEQALNGKVAGLSDAELLLQTCLA
ncbi:MAG: hypothetical protein R2864_08075 [Syntrophotaleaceae bacterium]